MTRAAVDRVSVIVPTRDRSALLRQALASVRAIEGPDLALELIVVDNGSTDNTVAVVQEFGARLVQTLTPGPAATRNAGIRAATGEYLAFLDDDDVWLPGHLRPHLQLLRRRPDLMAVLGQVVNADSTLTLRANPWPERLPDDGDLFARLLQYQPQIGATVTRTSVRESIGYQDEALIGGEDWDWHLRIAQRHPVGFVAVPCVLFRQYSAGSRDELSWRRTVCGRKAFWRAVRNAGDRRPPVIDLAWIFLRLSGGYAHEFLRGAAAHAAEGDGLAARRALWWALRTSPPHTIWSCLRNGGVRSAFWMALRTLLSARGDEKDSMVGAEK